MTHLIRLPSRGSSLRRVLLSAAALLPLALAPAAATAAASPGRDAHASSSSRSRGHAAKDSKSSHASKDSKHSHASKSLGRDNKVKGKGSKPGHSGTGSPSNPSWPSNPSPPWNPSPPSNPSPPTNPPPPSEPSAVPSSPPPVDVLQHTGRLAPGDDFITPTATGSSTPYANGPEILNDSGQPIWFLPLAAGADASDFRVQTYQGQPVLTWWEGTALSLAGPGPGTDYIANDHYEVIATVNAGNGDNANGHEFQLTPWGTALITIYKQVPANLTSVGGPEDGQVIEGAVQEINVQTGQVLFEWNSLDHVPVDQSYEPLPKNPSTEPWEYFHINAVKVDPDGNLIVSARHTWTIYKINIHTGATIWQLGGTNSSFKLQAAPGTTLNPSGKITAWQHDPEVISENASGETLTIFDNESAGEAALAGESLPYSRIVTVHIDYASKTATLIKEVVHPDKLSAPSQGDAQPLSNGDTFVGWGQLGRYSEFNAQGNLLYDVTLYPGYDTYRAYRDQWSGSPNTSPTAVATTSGSGESVQAVWNGATQVAYWQVLGGSTSSELQPVGAAAWSGLDTTIALGSQPAYVQVVAYNEQGQAIGQSQVTPAGS